ncbi:MAG: prolipoprotein diacylglyceryl transferase [candidate division Zixibacteria bacterium]|nr:prolipoprotein diacylglyceryl transferase [candidate division Zixibacteria bacterium]
MCPELFHLGPLPIRSFGLAIAVSFLAGVLYIMRIARRDRKPVDQFVTIAYLMIFSGLLGARLFYVLFHLEEFSGHWLNTINPFQGSQFGIAGLNLYGGILVGIVATLVYCRIYKLRVLDVFDTFAAPLALGIGISRIGCFLNGCCFGTPTDLPWSIQFPIDSIPYSVFGPAHIHPTQIYSSLYGVGLFVLLHFLLKHRKFVGQVTAAFFMIEAVFRYFIETIRYYEQEMVFSIGGTTITYNQVISVSLFAAGVIIYLTSARRRTNLT